MTFGTLEKEFIEGHALGEEKQLPQIRFNKGQRSFRDSKSKVKTSPKASPKGKGISVNKLKKRE